MKKILNLSVFAIIFALCIQVIEASHDQFIRHIDKTSDVSDWIYYEKIVPAIKANGEIEVVTKFRKKEQIGFVSIADIYKTAEVTWYDTLYCGNDRENLSRKLKTQRWSDIISESDPSKKEIVWEYKEDIPRRSDLFCQLRGHLILTTTLGNQKVKNYQSDIFEVNR